MDFQIAEYYAIAQRRGWLIAGVIVAFILGSLAVILRMTPVYSSTARIEIIPVVSGSGETGIVERLLDPSWARTQIELIRSDDVLALAAQRLDSPAIRSIGESLGVSLVPDTQIADIVVEDSSPERAATWANGIAEAFIEYRRNQAVQTTAEASEQILRKIAQTEQQREALADGTAPAGMTSNSVQAQLIALQTRLLQVPDGESLRRGGGNLISPAKVEPNPVRPNFPATLGLAALLGLIVGGAGALVMENLDDRLTTPEEIESKVSVPTLGYIPLVPQWIDNKERQLASADSKSGPAFEAYWSLGINLMAARKVEPSGCILITSAVANAGKSTTSANLAATLARNGNKVILVAGDLRKPSIHKFFQLPNMNGIVDVVHDGQPLYEALQQNSIPNFRLLAAGGSTANPTATLGSKRFTEILADLKAISDVVIIDSTPILGLGDASVLASKVDAVILVVNKGAARGRELAHAAQQVAKAGGRLIGCVINGLDPQETYSGYYDYGRN